MPVLRATLEDDQMSAARAWKRRYAESVGVDPELVTWEQVIMAYANSRVLP